MSLIIDNPATEKYNTQTEEFVSVPAFTLELEHSLISVSKWESRWHKSFLDTPDKTNEQTLDYIRCMLLRPVKDFELKLTCLTKANMQRISEYIKDPMTATVFSETAGGGRGEFITSELIYYWMIAAGVPFECQKWHLNRLITLIRVCGIKSGKQKKMSTGDIYAQNARLNAARRAALNSKG